MMFSLKQKILGAFAGAALTATAAQADMAVDPYQYGLTGTLGGDPFEISLLFEEANPDTDPSDLVVPSITVLDGSFTWRGETISLPGWGAQLDPNFNATQSRLFNVWFPNGGSLVQTVLAPNGVASVLNVLARQLPGSISLDMGGGVIVDGVVEHVHFNNGMTEVWAPEKIGTVGLGGAVLGLAFMGARRRVAVGAEEPSPS